MVEQEISKQISIVEKKISKHKHKLIAYKALLLHLVERKQNAAKNRIEVMEKC